MTKTFRNFLVTIAALAWAGDAGAFSITSVVSTSAVISNGMKLDLIGTFETSMATNYYRYLEFEGTAYPADTFEEIHGFVSGSVNGTQQHPYSNAHATTAHLNLTNDGHFVTDNSFTSDIWRVIMPINFGSDFNWGATANDFLGNVKIFRLWNPGSPDENFFLSYDGDGNIFKFSLENLPYGAASKTATGEGTVKIGQWNHWDFYSKDNSAPNVADSYLRWRSNFSTVYTTAGFIGKDDYSQSKRIQALGLDNVRSPNNQAPDTNFVNDLLIQAGAAQVVWLSSNTACTGDAAHHQFIESHTQTKVIITVHLGNLDGYDPIYVCYEDNSAPPVMSAAFNLDDVTLGEGNTDLNAQISSTTTRAVTVTWDNIGAGVRYQLVASTDSGFAVNIASGITPLGENATTSLNLPGLNAGGTVYVEVKVSTEGTFNGSISTRIPTTDLGIIATSWGSSFIGFTWTAVPSANYIFAMSTSTNFVPTIASGTLTSNTTTPANLTASNTYYTKVKLTTEAVVYPYAQLAATTTPASVSETDLAPSFQGVTSGSATITWTNVTGNSYQTSFATSSDFTGALITSGITPANQSATTSISLNAGSTVHYRVKITTEGDGAYNDHIEVMILKTKLNLSAVQGSPAYSAIDLSWLDAAPDHIWTRATDSDCSVAVSSTATSDATATDSGLNASTQYGYKVWVATESGAHVAPGCMAFGSRSEE